MKSLLQTALICSLSAVATLHLHAQGRWKVQYFHDEDRSSVRLTDIAFPSATTGIACGVMSRIDRDRPEGIVLVTRDGGKAWQEVKVNDLPVSLHFVDDSTGFLVTGNGIWKTEERGLTWKRVKEIRGILRVHFLNRNRGFAIGMRKQVLSTDDGGVTWKPVAEAQKPAARAEYTTYQWITFDGPKLGMILGGATPPRRSTLEVPDWADPEAAMKEREWPTLSIKLETKDGGATWSPQTAPVFGRMSRLRFAPNGGTYGLALMRYERAFAVPSEVYLVNWKTGKSETTFKDVNKTVTDVAFFGPSHGIVAAIERPGTMAHSPLPGKLKILSATNLRSWIEMPVDYRATGLNAMLAVVDEKNAWVALDSGMILRLEP